MGKPDIAPMIFANSILKGIPKVLILEKCKEILYIEDIVDAIIDAKKPATPNSNFNKLNPEPSTSDAPHRIFNLGNGNPIKLLNFIEILEDEFSTKAIKDYLPMQPGDVEETASDSEALKEWIDFYPETSLRFGINKFSKWFLNYYKL